MQIAGFVVLGLEEIAAIGGLMAVWGMWIGAHSQNQMDQIAHEWDAMGVFLGGVPALILALISLPLLHWGWTVKHWYVHLPMMIVTVRLVVIMMFNA